MKPIDNNLSDRCSICGEPAETYYIKKVKVPIQRSLRMQTISIFLLFDLFLDLFAKYQVFKFKLPICNLCKDKKLYKNRRANKKNSMLA